MQYLESQSQAECGQKRVPRHDVDFYESARTGDCYSKGIYTCGSVWTCPVCSRRAARKRGDELQRAIEQHLAQGGGVHMVTATIPHHAGHSLEVVYEAVSEAWRYLKSGSPWERIADRIGYIGSVRGVDATHGANGWHAHLHTVFFLDDPLTDEERVQLEQDLFERWSRKIRAFWWDGREKELKCRPLTTDLPRHHDPLFGAPSPEHAIVVSECESSQGKAGLYVSKMGLGKEATSMIVKGGRGEHRTPWQILLDYVIYGRKKGSREHCLWAEWITTMSGKRSLFWSPGLRDRFELEEADDQLDAFEGGTEEDRRVATVHAELWDELTRHLTTGERYRGGVTVEPVELDEGLCMVLQAGGPELALHVLRDIAKDALVDPDRVSWSDRDRTFYLLSPSWVDIRKDEAGRRAEKSSRESEQIEQVFSGI